MVLGRSRNKMGELSDAVDRHVDGLTGLPDRWQVEVWISDQLTKNRRTGDRFGFFLVSVSNLADINAGYGSGVGDEVLQAVAESLTTSVGSRGSVARYLGSEFAVIWPGLFGSNEMSTLADGFLETLPKQVSFENFIVPVDLAIAGIISDPDLNERLLTVDTEVALAEAKNDRSRSVVIRDETHNMRRSPEVLAVRLQRAFDNDEFQLYYQPIVSLKSGTIVGFESMLRWLAPDAGPLGAELIAPGMFLAALRNSPITVPLHAWILIESIRQVDIWAERLDTPTLFAAANMDPRFVADELFADIVLGTIEEIGVRPQQVLLDINANVMGDDIHHLWPVLADLKSKGVGIALEDYGVGFGSASLLRRCRFDVLRLPRSMVGGLGLADEDDIIANGIIRLAHDLGSYVVAEGVETEDQVRRLRSSNCDLVQGFLFGRPTTDTEIDQTMDQITDMARRARSM